MGDIVQRSLRLQIKALKEESERERGFTNSYIRRLHVAQDRIDELEAAMSRLLAAGDIALDAMVHIQESEPIAWGRLCDALKESGEVLRSMDVDDRQEERP